MGVFSRAWLSTWLSKQQTAAPDWNGRSEFELDFVVSPPGTRTQNRLIKRQSAIAFHASRTRPPGVVSNSFLGFWLLPTRQMGVKPVDQAFCVFATIRQASDHPEHSCRMLDDCAADR
jgi:hypothetical protein